MQEHQANHLRSINVKSNWSLDFRTVEGIGDSLTLCVEATKVDVQHPLTMQTRILAAMRVESLKKSKFITKLSLSHELFDDEILRGIRDAWQQWTGRETRLEIGYETFSEQLELVAATPSCLSRSYEFKEVCPSCKKELLQCEECHEFVHPVAWVGGLCSACLKRT